ncbi:MAG: hypothetical protein LBV18_00190 [Alistipes sp.]|nr:hypothetical protein [Alistipes sp.]
MIELWSFVIILIIFVVIPIVFIRGLIKLSSRERLKRESALEKLKREQTPERATVACPYCAETIMAEAQKCKHCGEWLAEKPTE